MKPRPAKMPKPPQPSRVKKSLRLQMPLRLSSATVPVLKTARYHFREHSKVTSGSSFVFGSVVFRCKDRRTSIASSRAFEAQTSSPISLGEAPLCLERSIEQSALRLRLDRYHPRHP